MFDVNSLGGKLIDNQNLKKALESSGGSSAFEIAAGNNSFIRIIDGVVTGQQLTFEQMAVLWEEHNGNIIVRHLEVDVVPSRLYFQANHYVTQSFGIYSYGGLSDGLGVTTKYICLTSDGYLQDTEGKLYGNHAWIVSAQNDD